MTEGGAPQPLGWGHKPLVAIVGRPNVGKSSLFNALLGRRTAIVSEIAGTTRDRLAADVEYAGREMLIADTGGLVPDPETEMEAHIAAQVEAAIGGADAVIFVTDSRQGVTYADEHVAAQLRRWSGPVVLAVNKADNLQQETLALELYELGLGDPIPVSALQRRGLDDVLEAVLDHLPPPPPGEPEPVADTAQIAIVGRPNVGKSALANAILGVERSIVSPVAGTTRDALDTPFIYEDQRAVIVDTAGIRRRGAIERGIEKYSVLRAVRAIDRCDVAVLVMDATQPATDQDLHIAGQIMSTFKGAVVAVNKWDLIEDAGRRDERAFRRSLLSRLRFMPWVPVVFISALEGEGMDDLLRTAFQVYEKRREWVPQPELTPVVMGGIARHLPPSDPRGSLKLYRVKQEAVEPPAFVFYCNNPTRIHFSYERYLENTIREAFGFEGTHLKLEFRGKGKIHIIGQNRAKHAAPESTRPKRSTAPKRGRR
ncbi:MAG: ribosome biogenesis GTPase Der [Dehalococcoidia bacterium]